MMKKTMKNLTSNISFIKYLKGHSGCKVSLFRDYSQYNEYFVRKEAKSKYSNRLVSQFIKQDKFWDLNIKSPICYGDMSQGEEIGSWYFDMEYIPGISFVEFVNRNSIEVIKPYFQKIINWIKSNNQLEKTISGDFFIKLDKLNLKRGEIKLESKIFQSYCHGDLTLENIIISNGDIYFIDFLDSPVNCQEMDVAKLLQDIYLGWSWRNNRMPIAKCKALYDMLYDEFDVTSIIHSILKLNLFRIKPYANEEVNRWIKYQIQRIESL